MENILLLVTKVDEWSFFREVDFLWYVNLPQRYLILCIWSFRNRLWVSHPCFVVITMSTAHFSRMSQSLITLRAWKLKKKLIKSDG